LEDDSVSDAEVKLFNKGHYQYLLFGYSTKIKTKYLRTFTTNGEVLTVHKNIIDYLKVSTMHI
jgi:hypothetical protein